jgi:signal transduction histidine kinase
MNLRSRLLIAFLAVTVIPLALLAVSVRRQLTLRVLAQYRASVTAQAQVARDDLARESDMITARLGAIARALETDDRFRLAVRGVPAERPYLLDYARSAMQPAGLTMLQIQDGDGRIISSGHFRNEFDRLEAELPRLVRRAPGATIIHARAAEGPFLALVRTDSVVLGGRRFELTGGIAMDSALLRRFARDASVSAMLAVPDSVVSSMPDENAAAVADIALPYIGADRAALDSARLLITQPLTGLRQLQRDVDRWFVVSLFVVAAAAIAVALWSASRLSAPVARLVEATERIGLDGSAASASSAVAAVGGRADEIGVLARTLDSMARRLRSAAVKLREAERRATVGEMARQVNHDIKNGLIPIRNVLRHLGDVADRSPDELPTIFAERRGTMESSVSYLETLAQRYARLAPVAEPQPIDATALVRETVAVAGADGAIVEAELDLAVPPVTADPIILRRILENLIRNGIESMNGRPGRVTVRLARGPAGVVRLSVTDTGRGMSEEELARAFDDFFTTKAHGTGLGLSVVRRLTVDLGGSLRVESRPGHGTTFSIDLPAVPPRAAR